MRIGWLVNIWNENDLGNPADAAWYTEKKSLKIRLYIYLYIHIIIHDDDQILLVHHLKSSQSYLLLQALVYSHQLCTGFNQLLTGKSNLCFTFAWASYFSHSSEESDSLTWDISEEIFGTHDMHHRNMRELNSWGHDWPLYTIRV